MADHCAICDTRRPDGGTNILILNEGKLWIEFCEPCGEQEMMKNETTGEEISVKALFDRIQETDKMEK